MFMLVKRFALLAVILIALVALSAGPVAEAAPPHQDDIPQQTITVTGYGHAYGAPDIVRVGLGVEASDADILVAMEDTNARMNAVMEALQAGGVAAEDIRTDNYSIFQDYGYGGPMGPGEQPAPVYRVSIGVTIVIRDTDSVGELLAAAVGAGANMVNYMQFDLADRASLESEARNLAVADAHDRAAQLAATLGVQLGDPVRVIENSSTYGPMSAGMGGGGGVGLAVSPPPISEGTLSVDMAVTISYILQ
jgi:uncharacterized protein YggE